MTITAAQVKELRDRTGAGMMDAKKALEEANGDADKAVELLRQKGVDTAAKKAGRAAAEGVVEALVADDRKSGVLVEINCETDFVAKGDAFQKMVKEVVEQVFENQPANLDALLAEPSKHLSGKTVQEYVAEKVGSIKENLNIRRFVVFTCNKPGAVQSYIHMGGKIGVLVDLCCEKDATANSTEFLQLAKDLSLQIASAAPEFRTRDDISPDVIAEETRVEMGKEDIQKKPPEIREKIVTGRVNKLLGERVLLEQPFVKDPAVTVNDLLKQVGDKLGDTLTVSRFTRYMLGEGIEKKESNFAEEVAAAAKV